MQPLQQSFDSLSGWMLNRLQMDLAPFQPGAGSDLQRFFAALYADMRANPAAYFIPYEPFVPFIARVFLTREEKATHETLKTARMRVRNPVFAYLEFLFELGKASAVQAGETQLPQATFDKLVSGYSKKAKNKGFLKASERCGLSFSAREGVIVISNSLYPAMPGELAIFSQACAPVKDFDFYLFRRCDLAVFEGKKSPEFTDALRLAPQEFQHEVAETDSRLIQMRCKREIFVDGGDATYRVRYSKKSDQLVYWCYIQETFQLDLHHLLRWRLESDVTPRLLARLEQHPPGLAERVFNGLKTCAHCYENCIDRKIVTWNGVTKEACQGSAWNQIGYEHADYANLWLVLETLDTCINTAK